MTADIIQTIHLSLIHIYAMKNAYLRSAVKNAAGAASSTVSKLSDSELGAMAEACLLYTSREVNHPKADELVLVAQSQLVTHFKAQLVQLLAGLHGVVTAQNQNPVSYTHLDVYKRQEFDFQCLEFDFLA